MADGDLQKQIDQLRVDIADLKNDLSSATESASNFNSEIGKSNNILLDMVKTVKDMSTRMLKFTGSLSEQYKLAEQIAEQYKQTSLTIGLSVSRSKDLNAEFKGSAAYVSNFGGQLSDVRDIYENFADNSGRVRILGEEEVGNIFKLKKATNLFGNEAESLYETLELMGVSNEDATARMNNLLKDSQSIGLNSSKVVKVLATNLKSMQTYSFSSGVKGMTEMAKQAVRMRIDVGKVLSMADKFYQPEAAIEAAANLQMLGGEVASAFGDPIQLMYEARNAPEELMKRIQGMTENMLQFNKVTGEYDISAEQRMQLSAIGDQLGFNIDDMVEMTRQSVKSKDAIDKLDLSGKAFDEDTKEGIAALSRIEDGNYVVDIRDEDGKKSAVLLENLTKEQAENALLTPESEEEYMDQMLYNSQTTNERLKNIEETFKKSFVAGFDAYEVVEDVTGGGVEATNELFKDMLVSFKEGAEGSDVGPLNDIIVGIGSDESRLELGNRITEAINGLNTFGEGKPLDIEQAEITIENLDNLYTGGGNPADVSGGGGNPADIAQDFVWRPGEPIQKFDKGDIVMGVAPVNPVDGSKVKNTSGGVVDVNLKMSGNLNVSNPDGSSSSLDMNVLKAEIEKMIVNAINQVNREGGKTDSKTFIDSGNI